MDKKVVMVVMVILMVVSLFFAWQGVSMHKQVSTQEASFHALQNDYFSLDKAERDGAAANSDLNKDLVEIKNFPSDLLRLKLVGVGKILTGIYVLLFGILIALVMMPVRLASLLGEKGAKKKRKR
jgi:hypothetical protein